MSPSPERRSDNNTETVPTTTTAAPAPAAVSKLPALDLSLPARPAFALPSRPSFPSSRPRPIGDSPSPPHRSYREKDDFYRPVGRSPSPGVGVARGRTDTYIPGRGRGGSSSRSRSRSRSLSRSRSRSRDRFRDRDRDRGRDTRSSWRREPTRARDNTRPKGLDSYFPDRDSDSGRPDSREAGGGISLSARIGRSPSASRSRSPFKRGTGTRGKGGERERDSYIVGGGRGRGYSRSLSPSLSPINSKRPYITTRGDRSDFSRSVSPIKRDYTSGSRSSYPPRRRSPSHSTRSPSRSLSPSKGPGHTSFSTRSYTHTDSRDRDRDRDRNSKSYNNNNPRKVDREEVDEAEIQARKERYEAEERLREGKRRKTTTDSYVVSREESKKAAIEKKQREKEAQEQIFAEERARKAKLAELHQKRLEEERLAQGQATGGTKSLADRIGPSPGHSPAASTSSSFALAKAIPTGPRARSTLYNPNTAGAGTSAKPIPTGPRSAVPPSPASSTRTSALALHEHTTDRQSVEQPAYHAEERYNGNGTAVEAVVERQQLEQRPARQADQSEDEDMAGPSRGRGRGGSTPRSNGSGGGGGGGRGGRGRGSSVGARRGGGGGGGGTRAILPDLEGSLLDKEEIMSLHGQGVELKAQWAENPKAPLANFLGGGTGGADGFGAGGRGFVAQEGLLGGNQKVFRVTVVVDEARGIIGIGDDKSRKEAEKLAALSAVLQMQRAGLLDGRKGGQPSGAGGSGSAIGGVSAGSSSDTVKLQDGSEITYDRARQFMEFYCKKYRFGKPEIEFSQSSVPVKSGRKHGGKQHSTSQWDAVISVGGRKIGMGSAQSKKQAQVKCYLDVTQYLESCDPDLWLDFVEASKKDPSANIGLAPHLFFQMSDELNEDVQGLCGDLRGSNLVKNAPPSGGSAADQPLPTWAGSRVSNATESQLQAKSDALYDKYTDYQNDPKLEKMRKQRDSLPVTSRATDILAKIEVNDVTIVMAATGSGKTTQIPQLLFDDYIKRGMGARCNIICTQPRRLAAMSVAERIADERGDPLGREVGYQVRFDAKLPQPDGSITFCTTGIFLKRMQSALGTSADKSAVRALDEVTHIVVDEVHERDIDTDLSLVVLKRLLADRKARGIPIKVILMSATIDASLFQRYFADDRGRLAPIAEVPGRTFPVERHYLDSIVPDLRKSVTPRDGGWVFQDKDVVKFLDSELSSNKAAFGPGTGMELAIPYPLVALTIAYVMQQSDDGHVLVFLPGLDEIKKVADILLSPPSSLLGARFSDRSKYSVHFLHSSIPAAEQKEVFRPPPEGVRRVILATNIAETSVTIPDVVYVVDTGRVKEKRYDPERHMSSLVSAWVGSSNLHQRAGRAGRHREGEYYGLVSNNRLQSLDPHQLVEMKRSDLSNVVMHVKALNLGEVEDVLAATIEPPEIARIVAAMQTLRMLGALDSYKNLTALGRVLLQLPVDAAIGKMCLYGSFFRCLDSALTLASILTNRDPFLAPLEKKQEADAIKDSWSPPAFRSDPLAITAAYNVWSEMDDRGSYGEANAFCHDNFLSKQSLLQIKQVKESLLQSLDQAGVIAVSAGGGVNVSRVGRRRYIPAQLNENGRSLPLLAALISMASAPNFALRTSEKICRTAQDKVVMIHASSINSPKRENNVDVGQGEDDYNFNFNAPTPVSFNPAEKRLYAFVEKSRTVATGKNANNAPMFLRNVTRLDPMTYMLFGAYELVVTQRGLECDTWLPVTGNIYALDDVQRLKGLLETAMLRVFEGVGKALTRGRDERWANRKNASHVQARQGGKNDEQDADADADHDAEGENESDDEGDNENGSGGAVKDGKAAAPKRIVPPLSTIEIQELEMLTTDVVRILDAYAAERESAVSRFASRAPTPGPGGGGGTAFGSGGRPNTGAYVPPGRYRG